MRVLEMTNQVRVVDFEDGLQFYRTLFHHDRDFVPHEGLAKWEFLRDGGSRSLRVT